MSLELTAVRAFGLARLAIGTAGMIAPRSVARLFGAPEDPKSLVYSMAARDLVLGTALLLSRRPAAWLVAAAAGDASDVGLVIGHSSRASIPPLKTAIGILGAGGASLMQYLLARRVRA